MQTQADEMASLILKRASTSRPDGQWSDEDYDVLADGRVVGRIYEQGGVGEPPELRWLWSVMIVPANAAHVPSRQGDGH